MEGDFRRKVQDGIEMKPRVQPLDNFRYGCSAQRAQDLEGDFWELLASGSLGEHRRGVPDLSCSGRRSIQSGSGAREVVSSAGSESWGSLRMAVSTSLWLRVSSEKPSSSLKGVPILALE